MARIRPGHRIGFVVIGADGLPFRFNGSNAYFHTYNLSHQAAELFWEREDANWVLSYEKGIYERIGQGADAAGVRLMRVEVPVRFEPSVNVRTLRMAHEDMNGFQDRRVKRAALEGLKLRDVK